MIFTARELQEKCHVDLYMTFVDLTKALIQSVMRDWKIKAKFGLTQSESLQIGGAANTIIRM